MRNRKLWLGRYEILWPLGEGSSGRVYAAIDRMSPGTTIALKAIENERDPIAVNNLKREFEVLTDLHHPNLIRPIQLHIVPGTAPFAMTMELIRGKPFLSVVDSAPLPQRLALFAQICSALHHLHRHEVAHRDIKSENILVETRSDGARVILTDFDLSGRARLQFSQRAGGTPRYLPPEVIAGRPADISGDIYSLGVLLFRTLTGIFPNAPLGTNAPPRELYDTQCDIPPSLCSLVERMLQAEPESRPGSILEIWEILKPQISKPTRQALIHLPPATDWPMVGKQTEKRRIRECIESTFASPINNRAKQNALLLVGEQSAGKTRLLLTASLYAQTRGLPVIRTTFSEGMSTLGYLRRLVGELRLWLQASTTLANEHANLEAEYAAFFQSISASNSTHHTPGVYEEERLTWFRSQLEELLSRVAASMSFVLLLDDIHKADSQCLRVIDGLFASSNNKYATIATVQRGTSAEARVRDALPNNDIAVELGALEPPDIATLIDTIFADADDQAEVASQLHRITGGAPTFIDLTLQDLRSHNRLSPHEFGYSVASSSLVDYQIPASVRQWTRTHLQSLRPQSTPILALLAISRRPLSLHTIRALTGIINLEDIVRELHDKRIVRATDLGPHGKLEFAHSVLADASLEQLGSERRREWHSKYADYLRDMELSASPPPAEEIARHLREASRIQEATSYAIRAGKDHLIGFALEEAEAAFRLALSGLDTSPDHDRLDAMEGLAESLTLQYKLDEAREQLSTLIRHATEADLTDFLARGLAAMAEIELKSSQYEQAEELSQRALRIAQGTDDASTLARVLKAVADTCHYQSKLPDARNYYSQLVSIRESLGDDAGSARAWHDLGWVTHSMRRYTDAAEHFRRAAEIYRKTQNHGRLANALCSVGACELDGGQFSAAVEILHEALDQSRASRSRRTEGICLTNLGQALHRLGDLTTATSHLNVAREIFGTLNAPRYQAPVELTIGWIQTDLGKYSAAEASLAKARELYLQLEDQPGLAHCLSSAGTVFRLLGDATSSRFWCERAVEIARAADDAQVCAVALTSMSLACLDDDRPREAVDLVRESLLLANRIGAEDTAHQARMAFLRISLMLGECQDVPALLQDALEYAELMQLRLDLPHVLMMQALLHARLGNLERATTSILRARSMSRPEQMPENGWEIRALCELLVEPRDRSLAELVRREANEWAEGVERAISDESRRSSFRARLRNSLERLDSIVQSRNSQSPSDYRSHSRSPSSDSELENGTTRVAPPNHSPATSAQPIFTGPRHAQDLLHGSQLLARRLPNLHEQSRARCILNTLVDRAIQMTRSDRGGLFLVDDSGDAPVDEGQWRLAPIALRSLERESLKDARELSRSMVEAAVLSNRPITSDELLRGDASTSNLTVRVRQIPAVLALPVFASLPQEGRANRLRQAPLGVLYLDKTTPGNTFEAADSRLGARVAQALALVLEPILIDGQEIDLAALESMVDRFDADLSTTDTTEPPVGTTHAFGPVTIVGGPQIAQVVHIAQRVSVSQTPVLIQGETGTGKELIARAIHHGRRDASSPFVPVDCGALAESMAEAELFGHRKGAFTGATASRLGLIRAASGGTLFLDEIGNLSPPLQLKLLRVLETGEVRPVGEDTGFPADFRLVAATNANLRREVARGRFRADLYHRLKGALIELPPLRERMEDLESLVEHLLADICEREERAVPTLSPSLWEAFQRHQWPGNVRELRMTLQAALAVSDGNRLSVEHVPELARRSPQPSSKPNAPTPGKTSSDAVRVPDALEGRLLLQTLARCGWDKAATARRIGWSRQKVYREMARYKIPRQVSDAEMRRLEEQLAVLSTSGDFTAGT